MIVHGPWDAAATVARRRRRRACRPVHVLDAPLRLAGLRRAAVLGTAALLVAGCDGPAPSAEDAVATTAARSTAAPPADAGAGTQPSPDAAGTSPSAAAETAGSPDERSAVGRLPEGFPQDVLPLPADAEVLVATYAPVGDPGAGAPYALSLNVRTAAPVADVMELYRGSLTAAGFVETVGTPAPGTLAAESTFSRSAGEELLVVGVLDRDGARTVTVGGRVRSAG